VKQSFELLGTKPTKANQSQLKPTKANQSQLKPTKANQTIIRAVVQSQPKPGCALFAYQGEA
jgi:hypothetical protein